MRFEVSTSARLARSAAQQWMRQYFRHGGQGGLWSGWFNDDKEATYRRLIELGDAPDPKDVDAAIGSVSWTKCECTHCQRKVEAVVHLAAPEPEDRAGYCSACLKAALAAIEVEA